MFVHKTHCVAAMLLLSTLNLALFHERSNSDRRGTEHGVVSGLLFVFPAEAGFQ
jgi:hypothetical protein